MKSKCIKKTYNTRKRAWWYAIYYFKSLGNKQSAYKCRKCKKFHLYTTKEMQISKELTNLTEK